MLSQYSIACSMVYCWIRVLYLSDSPLFGDRSLPGSLYQGSLVKIIAEEVLVYYSRS